MAKVSVSKTSGVLSIIIFVLLISSIGLLVLVLKGQSFYGKAIASTDNHPLPKVTQSLDIQGDATAETPTLSDEGPWLNFRLSKYVVPLHYDIFLHPDLENATFTGMVNITVKVTKETRHFVVHIKGLNISECIVYDIQQGVELNLTKMFSYEPNEYFVMEAVDEVEPGSYNLYLGFSGRLDTGIVGFYRGYYRNNKNETRLMASSKFQPTHARRAFPCFDEPVFKSTFNISLVHWKDYIALSNMPVEITKPYLKTNLYVTKFQKSVPMVTYLPCFIVCDFEYTEVILSSGKPFRVYSAPHLINTTTYALHLGSKILEYFEKYFEIDYPLPKMDMVAIPHYPSSATEHWGLITFVKDALLYDPEKNTPEEQFRVATVVSHELAHMWFGNLVTMEWWDDIWLNEGFASYIEYKGIEQEHPDWNILSRFGYVDLRRAIAEDSKLNSKPLVQPVQKTIDIFYVFNTISYAKGASVVRMMESFVGEKNFKTAISNYLRKYQYHTVRTSDLWEELSATCGQQGNRSFESIMRTWSEQLGFPYVTVQRIGSSTFIANQSRYFNNKMDYEEMNRQNVNTTHKYVWSIPLTYTSGNGTSGIVWIHDEKENDFSLPVTDSDWVKFNINQTGYYLVNYERAQWKRLADLLMTDHEILTLSDRYNLLFDSFTLAEAGYTSHGDFLFLSMYLKKETNFIPWQIACEYLNTLIGKLKNTETGLLLKNYIKDLTSDLYQRLGWEKSESRFDNALRPKILQLACESGNEDCLDYVSKLLQNWTVDHENPAKFPSLMRIYGMSKSGSGEQWDYLWNKYLVENSTNEKHDILGILGHVQDPYLISRYLEYTMNETEIPSEYQYGIYSSLTYNHVARPIVWNFIREKWPTLSSKGYSTSVVETICRHVTTLRELQEMKAFFTKYPGALKGNKTQDMYKIMQKNIDWINAYGHEIQTWLEEEGPVPWFYHRLPSHIVPIHYNLLLYPMLDRDIFNGSVAITVSLEKPSDCFLVHAVELNVTKIEVTSDVDGKTVVLDEVFQYLQNDYLVLKAKRKLPVGRYRLYFEFDGPLTLSLKGLYKSSYLDPALNERRYLATTQFEAIDARRAFPCFDEPKFKATFNVSIMHTKDYFALSNTIVESFAELDDHLRLTRFQQSLPMVTYLLAVVVCDFEFKETVTENGVRLRVYSAPHHVDNTNYSLDVGSRILTYFEKYFGIPFPLQKLDMIAIPDFGSNGMENWGLITYSEQTLISGNASNLSTKQIYHMSSIISHELAHMWFGDLVTMEWWNDLWLNEGFATYMATLGVKHVEPELIKEESGGATTLLYAMITDQKINSHPIVQPVLHVTSEIFDAIAYSKGSSVLRMLENYMGEDFREGISGYLKKYSFGNAKTEDLWNALTAASKQGVDVNSLMDTWTKQMNYPFVTIERKENTSSVYVIQQHRFLADTDSKILSLQQSPFNYVWQIPLTYRTSESKEISRLLLNTSEEVELTIPPQTTWIKFNADFKGYYSVNYSDNDWMGFIQILNNNHRTFSLSDRLNLLFDAFSMASAGHVAYDVPLNMTWYLKIEENFDTWQFVLFELSRIQHYFQEEQETIEMIREHLRSLTKDLFTKYTWNDTGDFSERKLRKVLISSACKSGNLDCLETAGNLFKKWIAGSKLSSETKLLVFKYGLKVYSDEETWYSMWNRYLEESDPVEKGILLQALPTVRNTTLLERLMQYAENTSLIRKHDFFYVMKSIAWNSEGFPLVTQFIFNNWTDLIRTHGVLKTVQFSRSVFSQYTTERDLEKVREFYKKHSTTKVGSRARSVAIENIIRNINWIKRHQLHFRNWMKNNVYMPWGNSRLPPHIIPTRYHITLHPNISTSSFEGLEQIELNITKDTDYIVVHQNGLNISEIELRSLSVADGEIVAIEEEFPYEVNEFYVIRFKDVTPSGRYVLKVTFSGKFSQDGKGIGWYQYMHRVTNDARHLLATQFEATHARKVFPCFDEPAMKAKFQLHIVHDSMFTAVSNMPEEKREFVKKGLTKTTFMETSIMSTYLLFCAVFDFEYLQEDYKGKKIRAYAPPDRLLEAEHGLNLTVKFLGILEEFFDVPFALPKLDSIAIPHYTVPGMEHWGAITYNSNRFLVDPTATADKKMLEVDRVIAHELVHQWFGNLVTMNWWSDLWLKEGVSTLIMSIPLREYHPTIEEVNVRKVSRMMCADSFITSHPIVRNATTPDEIADAFDSISYEKGAAVMKMLQYTLKDDFRRGLSNYLKKYAYKNAETKDLWEELSNATTIDIDIDEMMDTWTHQMGFPYIELKRSGDMVNVTQHWFIRDFNESVAVEIARKQNFAPFQFVWKIPLVYKNLDTGHEYTLWLNDKNATFQINATEDDVVKFNPGFVGFYIVKYDPLDWARLGQRLRQNHLDFSVTDRYNILHDAFILAETGRLDYGVPLRLSNYLQLETESMPWNFFREQILNLLKHLNGRSQSAKLLKAYVADLTSDLYDEYVTFPQNNSNFKKWNTRISSCSFTVPDLDFLSTIIDLACQTSYFKCLEALHEELKMWLQGQNTTLDLHFVFELAIPYSGSDVLWRRLYSELISNDTDDNHKYLMAKGLTAFEDPVFFEKTIDVMALDPAIDLKLAQFMFQNLANKPQVLPHLWNYTKHNWSNLTNRLDSRNFPYAGISTFCEKFKTKKQFYDMIKFLTEVPSAVKILVEGCLAEIEDAVKWSEKHEKSLAIWLTWNVYK